MGLVFWDCFGWLVDLGCVFQLILIGFGSGLCAWVLVGVVICSFGLVCCLILAYLIWCGLCVSCGFVFDSWFEFGLYFSGVCCVDGFVCCT